MKLRVRKSSRPSVVLLGAFVVLASACTAAPVPSASPAGSSSAPASSDASASTSPTPSATRTTKAAPAPKPVHVSLAENDGASYGVGMPIIAWFNVAPTDVTAFAQATVVKVNGTPIAGGWYFETTSHAGSALEGHYRPPAYWPAHATIQMDLPVSGLSAGRGLAFNNSLTLSMSTGAAHIVTVNASTLRMTVTSDGARYGTFPVSLGEARTPTARGTKVIMEKGRDISMTGPGYFDPHVQWTQRLTYGGEYLHSAPWNVANIGHRSTSNGCTNMLPADAKKVYGFLGIGDVVLFPNANGPHMQLGQGYGDWNVAWSQWLTGGALRIHA